MKKKKNWKTREIKKERKEINWIIVVLLTIIIGFGIYLYCCFGIYLVSWEEQQAWERYQENIIREKELQGQRIYKIKMYRDLYAVSFCESGHDDNASNDYSTALGRFQILDGTIALCEKHLNKELDRTNKDDSWECAIWLYERYWLSPWKASEWCWGDLIRDNI